MKIILTILFIVSIDVSLLYSQNGWVQQNSGINSNLNSIFFINQLKGWAAGNDGSILNTTNGGASWQAQNSNTSLDLNTIIFKDENTGWAAGGKANFNPYICQYSVIILFTSNGGANWNSQPQTNGMLPFQDITISGNKVFTCSIGSDQSCSSITGNILNTSNFGVSWNLNNLPVITGFKSMSFINSNTGWAAGYWATDVPPNINSFLKTTNAGLNWELIYADSSPVYGGYYYDPCNKILFTNEYTGFAVRHSSIGSTIIKSSDGGMSWFSLDSNLTSYINSMDFINNDTGWCVGYAGKIIRTNNGGINWSVQQNNVNSFLNSVDFIDAQTGWAAGNYGVIVKTITGGLTSVVNISNQIESGFKLEQNYPNPFNPKTIISYKLPKEQFISLKIYDILGKEVAELVNKKQKAGSYNEEFDAESYPGGIYFYTLITENFSNTKKMLLIK